MILYHPFACQNLHETRGWPFEMSSSTPADVLPIHPQPSPKHTTHISPYLFNPLNYIKVIKRMTR